MIANVVPVVASPEVVPDEVLDPATGTVDGLEKVEDLDDEFLALIYSDEELLRAEFDAVMAAAWSEPPTPARRRVGEPPPERPRAALQSMGDRLPLSVDTGRRTLGARTRAPPDPRQNVTASKTRGG